MLDKTWVHLCRTDPAYEIGALNFVRVVTAALGGTDMVICPCTDCRNVDRHLGTVVVDHLVRKGMDEDYKTRRDWYHHGEMISGDAVDRNGNQWNEEILGIYRAADYLDEELANRGQLLDDVDGEAEEKEEDEFLAKLADAETPLYPSSANHSKLSAIVSLYRIKTKNGWSDKSFNDLLETLSNMLPEGNVLHTSMYDVKKFLKSFDMGYEKIHACINDCCLFRKKFKKLDACPKCKASRWKINQHTGQIKKGVPQKVLRYFPIIPRLKRMFRSEQLAKDLRWHFHNKSSDGKLRHPVDSVTWDQVNAKYPAFAAEQRNIRLGLSTDGFNPFNMKNSKYSCWPVCLVNYNMAPDLCMKKENIMLTLLIPGPHQPGNNIDIYLEPLIDDLIHLWSTGELTYDSFSKSTFTLKAMLLWTISDFPAYGNLAGCKVKGKMGCPLCGKNTDSMWLSNCRKHVYMCHRKGLSPTHSYRGKKTWFDGKAEHGIRDESYLDTKIDWIPSMRNLRLKDIPSFIRATNPEDIMLNYFVHEADRAKRASAIILNTFDSLEHDVIQSIQSIIPQVYTIGPLNLLVNREIDEESEIGQMGTNMWKEEMECLDWLDTKSPNSVVYVNFGSITVMSAKQLLEFAWGLAATEKDFLWVIRPDLVAGDAPILPPKFLLETADRRMLASWCPQEKVLSHPAIGGFLTHSGWNSTLESLSGGVPMVCWPFFAEQQTNCKYCCDEWEVGMKIGGDVRREEVEELVRELMDGDKGKKMREKAEEWRRLAEEATKHMCGSSELNFQMVVDKVLLGGVERLHGDYNLL